MTYRYANKWAYIELVAAAVITLVVYTRLHPEWWGWMLFSPFFLYMIFEGVRKVSYSLTVADDLITLGSFRHLSYSVSGIAAMNVWEAKAGRVAVVELIDGSRFHFSSRLEGFDELVGLLRSKAGLPSPQAEERG